MGQYREKTFDVTALSIPLQVTEFTPRAGDYSVEPFSRIEFAQFYKPHEELVIKPFENKVAELIDTTKDIKVTRLAPPIQDKEACPKNNMVFRVDLPFGPIVSLFIRLSPYGKCDLYTTTEQQEYLESYRIYADKYTLTVAGTPLLQTNINNTNLYCVPIYNTNLLIPKFSDFRNEKSKKYNAETFIKKHHNNGCHKPLQEAFDYINHYIKRVIQK